MVNEDDQSNSEIITDLLKDFTDMVFTACIGENEDAAAGREKPLAAGFGGYSGYIGKPIIPGQSFQLIEYCFENKPNPAEAGSVT